MRTTKRERLIERLEVRRKQLLQPFAEDYNPYDAALLEAAAAELHRFREREKMLIAAARHFEVCDYDESIRFRCAGCCASEAVLRDRKEVE